MTPSPHPISRHILGQSVQGRDIALVGFHLAAINEQTPIDTLFIGVFHGDEGISGELLQRFARELEMSPPDKSVALIPVLNPDGLAARTRVNANGVDLNRNYPAKNWALNDADSPYYGGPSAGSEPETRLIVDLIARYRPRKIITVHSPYRVLNFDGPAKELAKAMAVHSGYEVVESIGYPTPGSFGTYCGIERQIPVVTLELSPGVDDPPHDDQDLPPVTIEQAWAENRQGLWAAIQFSPSHFKS